MEVSRIPPPMSIPRPPRATAAAPQDRTLDSASAAASRSRQRLSGASDAYQTCISSSSLSSASGGGGT
eukprot:5438107-Prymnesium_polylepis.1